MLCKVFYFLLSATSADASKLYSPVFVFYQRVKVVQIKLQVHDLFELFFPFLAPDFAST